MEKYPIILDDDNHNQVRICVVPESVGALDRLHSWYDALECHCLQHVQTIIPGLYLLIDDNGKITDPPKQLNTFASLLYPGFPYDCIVGHAILAGVGMRDGEADIVPPSESHLRTLSRLTGVPIPGVDDIDDDDLE